MSNPTVLENVQAENAQLKQLQQLSFETTNVHNPVTLQEYANIAKSMAASGFFGEVKNAHQAVALMILGRHFNLSPVQSLTGIHIVKGKPMLHYAVILAKVREHPHYDYRIVKHDDSACTIAFTYKGEPCGESTFTKADAQKAGTQNMDKHGKTMLLARAASNGVKWYCPDVLNGMPVYVQGEIPEDADYQDAGKSRKDTLLAELQAKNVEREEAIVATAVDVASDGPERIGKAPEDQEGLL